MKAKLSILDFIKKWGATPSSKKAIYKSLGITK